MIRMPASATDPIYLGTTSHLCAPAVLESLPLLTHAGPADSIAYGSGRTVTVQEFLTAAEHLAALLPTRQYAVNLCRDRYHFLVAFAAALISRQTSLLPTCRAPGVLTQLVEQYPDGYILTDHDEVPSEVPSNVPRCLVSAESTHFDSGDTVPTIPSEHMAAIVFTSGSSGRPRAHAKTWGSLVKGAQALKRHFAMEQDNSRVVVGTVPAQHMYGLETTVMLPLQGGWSIHAGHPILPADIHDALEAMRRPVWLMTTPVHLRAFVGQRVRLRGLEAIVSATMPLDRSLAGQAEALWNIPVHEIYGCTEGGVIGLRRTTADMTWTLCSGLRIWQEGDAAWVEGGHVGQPLRLSDRISVQRPTRFILHGPSHDLVKRAGKRTSLAALNATLARIDGVVDGTFYRPRFDRNAEGRLTAFVVAPGIRASAIQAELRKRIDPVFLPRPLHLVDALPRNHTGKLTRERLDAFAADIALRHRPR